MGAPIRILLVDDDPSIRRVFRTVLETAGFSVDECDDGTHALARAADVPPALIVLDVEMPRMDGWRTLGELRRRGHRQPVLMLTHLDDVDSRVRGLEAGADDYVGKPCTAQELLARVRALLRRPPLPETGRLLHLGGVEVDLREKRARRGGEAVRLTRTDYALLELLQGRQGAPVSREEIIARIWAGKSGASHALDTQLWRLRKKLGDPGDETGWIRNVSGVGYALRVPAGGRC